MNEIKRKPTMQNALRSLRRLGVEFDTVLDVGVLTITQPLVDVCPDSKHHLFEPVDTHFDKIENNYRNIDHVLHRVALSDSDGEMFLACTSITNDGVITHSALVDEEISKDDVPTLVKCDRVRKVRLDTVLSELSEKGPYLLKIDVDGQEINVLRGADQTLTETSVVVIEAPVDRRKMPKFFERALYLMDKGFYLMDIVDLSYYDEILWQVDLIFVRKDIVESNDLLRPFQADSFSFEGDKWYALNEQKFAALRNKR